MLEAAPPQQKNSLLYVYINNPLAVEVGMPGQMFESCWLGVDLCGLVFARTISHV